MNPQKMKLLGGFNFKLLLPGLIAVGLLLSACGGSTTSPATSTAPGVTVGGSGSTPVLTIEASNSSKTPTLASNTSVAAQTSSSPAAPTLGSNGTAASPVLEVGGEAAGGDESVKTYADPAGQFSFQYPQSWGVTTRAGETIRFTGRDEFISISLSNTNLAATDFGKTDLTALTATSAGFKGNGVKAYQVAGTKGAVVEYSWQAGPSPVTGKLVPSSAKRYYIPGAGGKLAIFTYSSPNQNYDPAGADDFANAFKWLK